MTSQIAIRCATEADAEALGALSNALGYSADAAIVRSRLAAVLASQTYLMVVAEAEAGAVVGWLQAHASHVIESGFRVEITGLIVSPEMRRAGVGRLLVNEAERWARTLLAEAVVVRSNIQRTESHAFYPALGYTRTKTQAVYRKNLT